MNKKFKKIAVAMSGGVDSSVAAAILKDQGYEVAGFTIKTWDCDDPEAVKSGTKTCCSNEDVNDAREVAFKLDIPFYVIDAEEVFKEKVVTPFEDEYRRGNTPIPCTNCNEFIKWGYLYDQVKSIGFDAVATGHFARMGYDETSERNFIIRGDDDQRDQSFFLFSVNQDELAYTVFPVGNMTKEEVRIVAEKYELGTAAKPGSMDICFVKGGSYSEKIKDQMDLDSGDIYHVDGRKLGVHNGLYRYTIGQRRGIGVADSEPLYVIKLDLENNSLIIGPESFLFQQELIATRIYWGRLDRLEGRQKFKSKIRYRQPLRDCTAEILDDGRLHVIFDKPERAITPGQAVVLYDDEGAVALGAWIDGPIKLETESFSAYNEVLQ